MMTADLPPPPTIRILAPCPETPNCVSSLAEDATHRIEPLPLHGTPEEAIQRLQRIIERMPRAEVTEAGPTWLNATFRSLVFRFVDDLELAVDPDAGVIHVRSAARVGRSDLGVNRRRVETIRRRYRQTQ